MYAGRVACCPLVSHGKYVDWIDRWTDGRTPDCYITVRFPLDADNVTTIKDLHGDVDDFV